MAECLRKYGFDIKFIEIIKIMYKNLTAKIMIYGFLTEKINIKQSVKQGDALSCSLFVICIDPVIRQLNRNPILTNPILGNQMQTLPNTVCYADDISVIMKPSPLNYKIIFETYNNFSSESGLHLNVDKTEILSNVEVNTEISLSNSIIKLQKQEHVKICGKHFSFNKNIDIEKNITDKINKLERKLMAWRG